MLSCSSNTPYHLSVGSLTKKGQAVSLFERLLNYHLSSHMSFVQPSHLKESPCTRIYHSLFALDFVGEWRISGRWPCRSELMFTFTEEGNCMFVLHYFPSIKPISHGSSMISYVVISPSWSGHWWRSQGASLPYFTFRGSLRIRTIGDCQRRWN